MTRDALLHCITDRPCAVCRFNEDGNGCKKWNCVFEEKPENDTLDLDTWNDMIDELIEFEEKCNKENPDAVMWVHNAIGIVAKYDRLVKHPDDQMEHFKRLGEYYNGKDEDLISKQAVDDLFQQAIDSKSPNLAEDWKKIIWVREHIKELPSVTPQPCEDAISREDAIDALYHHFCDKSRTECAEILHAVPSVSTEKTVIRADGDEWVLVEPQESDHKCHTCKHYTSGERDGSCGSYICKNYSDWESEDAK